MPFVWPNQLSQWNEWKGINKKQGVALTGCNHTGPLCSVTMEL